ncbi:MFS superfamily sulfate permease-like transporter [Bradyrhizobium diazoefficiens]|uniref:Sulphate transport protein n=2 Tax=Bradyrhizobium diazoefficiens TaxID=1355477 RepID=A0A0E3VVZ2_9BRAD|nr:sulphate transport protein [Bradyrhizobium diazoefficiens]
MFHRLQSPLGSLTSQGSQSESRSETSQSNGRKAPLTLFFANAEFFKERVLDAVAKSPTPVRWLVVAAEPVTSVDVSAGDTIAELDEALHAQGIEFCFAELKDPVKDKLKRFGLFSQLGEQYFFPTIGAAVSSYLEINGVEWEDWEDQAKR